MRQHTLTILALFVGLAVGHLALSQAVTKPPSHVVVTPDELVWKPLMPGSEIAVVSGDPDKKGGIYVLRIRTKGDLKVPPHWHVTDEHITVLEGSFWVAHGDRSHDGC